MPDLANSLNILLVFGGTKKKKKTAKQQHSLCQNKSALKKNYQETIYAPFVGIPSLFSHNHGRVCNQLLINLVHWEFPSGDDELSSHSGQETPKGPCAIKAARKKLLNAIIFHGAIVHFGYTPDCDEEGYYKTMQCRHKTRREEEDEEKKKCWCVDRWGNCIKKDGKGRCKRGQPDELNCS